MDPRTTTALLYLNGVTVSFDGFRALDNLSLTIEPGEMRAVIGPNGAGKTTMMGVVTGKTRPDSGDVYFDGSHDLSRLDETEIALLGIGRKFQKPTVFEMHTVEDNIALALKGDRRARRALRWHETSEEAGRIDGRARDALFLDELGSCVSRSARAGAARHFGRIGARGDRNAGGGVARFAASGRQRIAGHERATAVELAGCWRAAGARAAERNAEPGSRTELIAHVVELVDTPS